MSNRGVGQPAPFLLTTVRHTGTNTALDIFRNYERKDIRQVDTGGFWFCHCERGNMEVLRQRLADRILISTMRNPMDVARSWIKRGTVLDEWFRNMWVNLFALHDEFNGLWLPVDTPDRDMRLQVISERLGIPLHTDWTPLNVSDKTRSVTGGMSLDECREFYRTLPFDEFYPEIDMVKKVAKKVMPVEHGFVFIGSSPADTTPTCSACGYMFQLNGRPVQVNEVAAARLRKHTHFKEV